MTAWQSYLDEQQPAFLEQLFDFLKIPMPAPPDTDA